MGAPGCQPLEEVALFTCAFGLEVQLEVLCSTGVVSKFWRHFGDIRFSILRYHTIPGHGELPQRRQRAVPRRCHPGEWLRMAYGDRTPDG